MKKLTLMLTALIIFAGCSKKAELSYTVTEKGGIKYFSNQNKPSDLTFKIEPKLLFSIEGDVESDDTLRTFTNVSDIETDSRGNIFLFDNQKSSIKKFDKDGNYLLSFGARGNGPGEFPAAFDIIILNDFVYVQSFTNLQMVKYDTDGKYIENIPYESGGLVVGEALRKAGKNILGYINSTENKEGTYYFGNNLVLFSPEFKKLATLREWNEKFDPQNVDFFKSICKYTSDGKKIFVAENSTTEYAVNVFDMDGKKSEEIKFPYARIQNNEEEEAYIGKNLQLGVDGQRLEQKRTFKRSVNDLFTDKNGNLLVRRSFERTSENKNDFLVDVFKDGVYLNTVSIPNLISEDIMVNFANTVRFEGDRIYQVMNDEAKINVYSY